MHIIKLIILTLIFMYFMIPLRVQSQMTFRGELDYANDGKETLINHLHLGYRKSLYETHDRKWLFFFGSHTTIDCDAFRKAIMMNGFIHLGVEF